MKARLKKPQTAFFTKNNKPLKRGDILELGEEFQDEIEGKCYKIKGESFFLPAKDLTILK